MTLLREILVQSLLVLLLLASVAGVLAGIGLILRTGATLALFRRLNHWVSSGIEAKAREEHPVANRSAWAASQRRVAGAMFLLGGAFAVLVLASTPRVSVPAALEARGAWWVASFMLADALRWILIIGCTAGAVAGVLLLFFPAAWASVEARANRWHSTSHFFAQTDMMHMPLDRWIERSPRPAGAVIGLLSILALGAFVALLALPK